MARSVRYHLDRIKAAEQQFNLMVDLFEPRKQNEEAQAQSLRRVAYAANHFADCLEQLCRDNGEV